MPRLGKKTKQEYALFMGANGRRQYNELCRRCIHRDCKQSYKVTVLQCRRYVSKRKKCK